LQKQWGQTMPEVLFTDERTNKMLLNLEDAMSLRHEALSKQESKTKTIIMWQADDAVIPLPIMGLEFTLSFYFPTSFIDLSYITDLYIHNWSLTGISNCPSPIDYEFSLIG